MTGHRRRGRPEAQKPKDAPPSAGEAKWSTRINAARIKAALTAKAAVLTPQPESLRYVVCGRDQVERADIALRGVLGLF